MMLWLCVCALALVLQPVHSAYNCSTVFNRVPDNNDLAVDCGTNMITLEVNLCTAEWAGFDPDGLALNGERNDPQCKGTIDTTVDPPVIRYHLPFNHSQENPCRQSLQIVDEVPSSSGPFSMFSSIQSVIITGYIDTASSSESVISYSTDLYYHFSCRYPLEYLINNTQIVASSVSVATRDNNGTFIDTLSMGVFNSTDFNSPLVVPPTGLELRSKVYVEVKAANLTGNFHLLLDHCFATPSPYNQTNNIQHTFFTGCVVQNRTAVLYNGVSKFSRFSFEAFRFVEHRNQEMSTIYLHCILRLCEPNRCQELLDSCNRTRRRRALEPYGSPVKDAATVSVGPLYTAALKNEVPSALTSGGREPLNRDNMNVAGVVVGVIFATGGAVLLVMAGWFVMKRFCWAGVLPQAFH
ncbi:zona pellucida-like domain-containing protein 1 [Carassius auratus]|uniref:Zona pellucida-like domain-containing protein 1 n=1 Tax=Carassius auratus TaxID=7957 RepID=A0A6P6R076_CARAU|nr:zona pellucida-like domain-containing protein 1 [Carassius auratus]XP_026138163.1 zona pellucida-like domain-containing protein 1 [Carassius auratus]XP_026138164.1 zona pellucida-like domain-containing protein 1 [Carassius auratus]XP_026138165.1 zona pellucida-like domain-containing protein 1 [Carassius auratus]